jgi:aubergine-like protein
VEEKEGGLMLTCDVSHRVLRSDTAYDVLLDARNSNRNASESFVDRAKKALLGQVVLTK